MEEVLADNDALADNEAYPPPQLLAANGLLYTLRGRRRLLKAFPVLETEATDNLDDIPSIDVSAHFKASDKLAALDMYKCRVIMGREQFLIIGYVDNDLTANHFLSLIKPNTIWRGEIAVFQLGKYVPTLATIRCPVKIVNAAIQIYISRITEALDGGKAPPFEIVVRQ